MINLTQEITATVERAWLSARLAEWHQMEALGLVAGGLAHELNNQITMIGHTVELAQMLNQPERYQAACEQILDLCERARKTVTQLQSFGRQGIGNRYRLDLGELTASTARLLRPSLGPSVEVKERIASGVYPVRANANQLQVVLIHLVQAGAAALPTVGGMIEIRLERGEASAAAWTWHVIAPGLVVPPPLWIKLAEGNASDEAPLTDEVDELAARLRGAFAAHGAVVRRQGTGVAVDWPACA